MANNIGYQNEYDFVELFNGKFLNELDNNSQNFLKELFDQKILNDEAIKAWKNKINQKADIFIKYKNYVKGISLKCGKDNSIHQETIENFKMFLESLGMPFKIIDYYTSYHYGYSRDENAKTDFSKCLSSDEYKILYQNEIDEFSKWINKSKIIIEMVDRFIIKVTNANYGIDAFVHGTIDNYVWLMKYDIYELILSKRNTEHSSPHIACMTIGPKKRNLNRNSAYARERYIVCIRWNFIKDDIINFKKL